MTQNVRAKPQTTAARTQEDANTAGSRGLSALSEELLNAEQVQERKAMLLAQEQDNPPALWWMSFCDPEKPKWQQFLGVAIVEAPGFMHAHQKAWALGINPGGEIQACVVEDVPAEYHDKLLSRAELEAAGLV